MSFKTRYDELTAAGWAVRGWQTHIPSRALGCVFMVQTLSARKRGEKSIRERFTTGQYPLFLYSRKITLDDYSKIP